MRVVSFIMVYRSGLLDKDDGSSAVLEVALFSSSRGHGIGTQLCQTLLDRAQHGRRRFYSILAFCSSDNADASSPAPDMFMLKNGFSRVYT